MRSFGLLIGSVGMVCRAIREQEPVCMYCLQSSHCSSARLAYAAGGPSDLASASQSSICWRAANQERAARGLQPLHRDPALARAAAQHAAQMAVHGGISHQFPGEPELTARGAGVGAAFTVIEENVAEHAERRRHPHEMWMNSRTPPREPAQSVDRRGGHQRGLERRRVLRRRRTCPDHVAAQGRLRSAGGGHRGSGVASRYRSRLQLLQTMLRSRARPAPWIPDTPARGSRCSSCVSPPAASTACPRS